MRLIAALATALTLGACGEKPAPQSGVPEPAPAVDTGPDAPAIEQVAPIDYSNPQSWLCRPEVADACEEVAVATAISADGRLTKDNFPPNPAAPIDCFYVYPTVSLDETPNSDIVKGPEEDEIARQQLARFGSVCRLYAPIYRQATLPALRRMLRGETPETNREMAYADIKAAWRHYLAHDNAGRGVVMIGHSQGAGLLSRLIAAEIDGRPDQQRLVSAVLAGANIAVGDPHESGGSFKSVPLCATADSVGCVIAWASFRADAPPPENSLFGAVEEQGMRAACVNPAELDGSQGQLKAVLPVGRVTDLMAVPGPWTANGAAIDTPFVTLPGLLSAACVSRGRYNYLEVRIAADPSDQRIDAIAGDVIIDGQPQPSWGLHPIDMNLVMGNLVEVVRRQGAAWVRQHSAASAGQPPKPN
jgi:hypothetical protein